MHVQVYACLEGVELPLVGGLGALVLKGLGARELLHHLEGPLLLVHVCWKGEMSESVFVRDGLGSGQRALNVVMAMPARWRALCAQQLPVLTDGHDIRKQKGIVHVLCRS